MHANRLFVLSFLITTTLFARHKPILEVGWFTASQGKSQHIDIQGLIGDDFSVTQSSDQNVFVGAGYYFYGLETAKVNLLYGINAFYFAPTTVKGEVTQENLFTNLSYEYSRVNCPIYFGAKTEIHHSERYAFTFDLGLGPNIASTGKFQESSLDGGITLPDTNMFSRKTVAAFSAAIGIGWQMRIRKYLSCEFNYRFFYLGEGELKTASSQLQNTLHTGNSYANALFLSLSL